MIDELRNLPAPAKLNLFLHITGRRNDGYHLLETVFDMIDIGDRLHLRVRNDGALIRRDTLPGVTVEGSSDGATWRPLGSADGQQAGVDVYDLHIDLDGSTACRYIRASFAAREPAQPMTLVEVEVWGRPVRE